VDKSIVKKIGAKPGKTVAIFAGIHGNEKVGIEALKILLKNVSIKSGVVYFVFANPLAIKKRVRVVNKNMNRLFYKGNKGNSYEDVRVRKLMKLLDGCHAFLDIHSYNSKTGNQFAITEAKGYGIIKKMNFPVVAEGFSKMGHGTDGYMNSIGKVGICIECGTTNRYKKFIPLAVKSSKQFLQYFGCIEKESEYDSIKQRRVKAFKIIYKKHNNFRFTKSFLDFERLPAGKPFAFNGNKPVIADKGECIIFPRPNVPIGGEVCVIAKIISK
jgi:succinylglutamate desuccinylase